MRPRRRTSTTSAHTSARLSRSGLASFPYVSYHSSFPYSVFLGPNGAQYNAPQMYWKDIGVSVDTIYANTYIANRIYGRPIVPLGQTYAGVSSADVLRFREEAVTYGASGLSYWDWQETPAKLWSTLATPLAPLTSVTPNTTSPELASGAKGDQVLWLQEHLASAIPTQETTGVFGSQTTSNLRAFQAAHALPVSGRFRRRYVGGAAGPAPRAGRLDGGRAGRLDPLYERARAEAAAAAHRHEADLLVGALELVQSAW